jgi:CDGSH-type Zn-finger protein
MEAGARVRVKGGSRQRRRIRVCRCGRGNRGVFCAETTEQTKKKGVRVLASAVSF